MNYPYSATEGKATKAKQDVFFVSFLLFHLREGFVSYLIFTNFIQCQFFSLRSDILSENRVFFLSHFTQI